MWEGLLRHAPSLYATGLRLLRDNFPRLRTYATGL